MVTNRILIIIAVVLFPIIAIAQMSIDKNSHVPVKKYYLAQNNVPGDSTDVTSALQTLMSGKRNAVFIADTNKTYYLTYTNDSLVIPEGCTFDGRGSKFHFEIDSTSMAFSFGGNDITLKNVVIDCDSSGNWDATDNGQYGTALSIGNYSDGTGYNGWTIENCSFEAERPGGNALFITGDSYNGKFINPTFPLMDSTKSIVEFHWGAAGSVDTTTEPFVTTHPHNISVQNVTIAGSNYPNSQGITLSACWGITVDGGIIKNIKRGVVVFSGDYGFIYADTSKYHHFDKDLFDYGSTFNRVSVYQDSIGFLVHGDIDDSKTNAATDSVVTRFPVTFNNCFTQGEATTPASGFWIYSTMGVMINSCVATNHLSGVAIGMAAYSTAIINSDFYGNSSWAIDVNPGSGVTMPDNTLIQNNRVWASSGIYTNYALRTLIIGNRIGEVDEAVMDYGIYIDNGSALNETSLLYNHIVDLKDGVARAGVRANSLANIRTWLQNTVDTAKIDTVLLSGGVSKDIEILDYSVVMWSTLDTIGRIKGVQVQDTSGNIADNDVLTYDAATGNMLWEAPPGAAGGTTDSVYVIFTDSTSVQNANKNTKGYLTPSDTLYIDTTGGAATLTYFSESDDTDTSFFTAISGTNNTVGFKHNLVMSGNSISGVSALTTTGANSYFRNTGGGSTLWLQAGGTTSDIEIIFAQYLTGGFDTVWTVGFDQSDGSWQLCEGAGLGFNIAIKSEYGTQKVTFPVGAFKTNYTAANEYSTVGELGDSVSIANIQSALSSDFHNIGGTDDDVPEAADYSNLTGGTGITNSPTGTINATLGTDIVTGEIVDQTIVKADIDTTSGFVVGSVYKITSAVVDSQYVTKAYADGLSGSGEVNTASNAGVGFKLSETKAGTDLPFKTVTGGTGITLDTATANQLNIVSDLGASVDLAAEITGTLPVANGGTGATTLTDGGILLGSGTGAVTALGVATNGQIPIGDGATDPVLGTISGGTGLTVTNGAGTISIAHDAHTGDVTGATGLTIAADKVLESHLKAVNAATDEDILTYETTTGDYEWHTPAEMGILTGNETITLSGDVTGSGATAITTTIGTDKIDSSNIKQQGIHGKDIDSTANTVVFSGAFKTSSAVATNEFQTNSNVTALIADSLDEYSLTTAIQTNITDSLNDYLPLDGSSPMSGALNMGTNSITGVTTILGTSWGSFGEVYGDTIKPQTSTDSVFIKSNISGSVPIAMAESSLVFHNGGNILSIVSYNGDSTLTFGNASGLTSIADSITLPGGKSWIASVGDDSLIATVRTAVDTAANIVNDSLNTLRTTGGALADSVIVWKTVKTLPDSTIKWAADGIPDSSINYQREDLEFIRVHGEEATKTDTTYLHLPYEAGDTTWAFRCSTSVANQDAWVILSMVAPYDIDVDSIAMVFQASSATTADLDSVEFWVNSTLKAVSDSDWVTATTPETEVWELDSTIVVSRRDRLQFKMWINFTATSSWFDLMYATITGVKP